METNNAVKQELENNLRKLYAELGEVFYRDNKGNTSFNNKYRDQFSKISSVFNELNSMDAKELEAKGLKRCPDCGKEVTLESLFCNMCGHKFGQEPAAQEEKKQNVCPHCGAPLEEDSMFCSTCGKHI
ncbi:MAG: zinc-ribbon domain-containing protein [Butyrivibrio sp.]|nr:zinc-ribbon domain-containing protein [Butyrivibrio sp.]